jgi:hypothetical protein
MGSRVRFTLFGLMLAVLVAVSAQAAQAAPFGIESFYASNCNKASPNCNKAAEPSKEVEVAEKEDFTQAGGHPPFGVTDFRLERHQIQVSPFPAYAPNGNVKTLRTDVAPGVSTNPQAVPECSIANFTGTKVEPIPGVEAFTESNCPGSEIGINKVETVLEVSKGVYADVPLEGKVYNLDPSTGLTSDYGVALNAESIFKAPLYFHTIIEGHVEWASDYHDYFVIKNITPGLLASRLTFKGNIGVGGFLTNPTSCTGTGPQTTTGLHMESYEGEKAEASYKTAIGNSGCNTLVEGFTPAFSLTPETTQRDEPDGVSATITSAPHNPDPEGLDSSQVRTGSVTLPEGMTLNPSAAHGLRACTPAQARINSLTPGVACPTDSNIGTVQLNVPGLPTGSLLGNIYLGGPESGPITAPPYTVYVDAESARYGVSVRLKGTVTPNPLTGQVTTTFTENPEQPFSELIVHFKGGALAPVANPLACGPTTTLASFIPFAGSTAVSATVNPFTVDSNGEGGACGAAPQFSLAQSAQVQPTTAAARSSFTFSLARNDGEQYLEQVKTTLPAGLLADIPDVKLCEEAQANAGTCSSESEIGTATVEAGSGIAPYPFKGTVYLTGPYNGAPYGMSVVVPAVAGPFNLGPVVTRAMITVNQSTAAVTITAPLKTIVAGIPVRLKALTVSINRQGFMLNPTNCSAASIATTLTSTFGGTQLASLPFQPTGCSALAFKPSFAVTTSGKPTKQNGASLVTTIKEAAGQANIKSVLVTLPKQLPSRGSTLQKACLQATFEANPYSCPSGSNVGSVLAYTPTLPGPMKGPAYFVSHGGAAFPDLDIVLEGNNGIRVILVGNTKIVKGITTTNFATSPDVPVSAFQLNLGMGPHSALAAYGSLCIPTLLMATTITGQNGKLFKQSTKITPEGCGVQIVGQRVIGNTEYLTVKTFGPGRITASGSGLVSASRKLNAASNSTALRVSLSGYGLGRRRPYKVKVKVSFTPTGKGSRSSSTTTATFR